MIDVIRVTKILKKAADISESEYPNIVPTVSAVCMELSERLRDKAYENDERVVMAAVYMCYYRIIFLSIMSGDTVTGFKAGDVTLSQSPSLMLEQAAKLRDEALLSASQLLNDLDFVFLQV